MSFRGIERFGFGRFGVQRFGGDPVLLTAAQSDSRILVLFPDAILEADPEQQDARPGNVENYEVYSLGVGAPVYVNGATLRSDGAIELEIKEPTIGESYQVEIVGNILAEDGGSVRGILAGFTGEGDNPTILSAEVIGPKKVRITFSEEMKSNTDLINPGSYTISGGLTIDRISVFSTTQIDVYLVDEMIEGESYIFEVG